ncbi:MAG: hypothetical protein LBT00_04360 [Spirochaetaceae bacterium]|nr:hypothetical protein [Spirochaetaceae bacterium]
MKNIRLLCLAVSSCAAALLAAVLTGEEGGGSVNFSSPFVVVECPASVSDREVAGALTENGMPGVISESTQFFLLSAWTGVEQVPLDMLDERLVEGDPRRDAYAQNMRAFFVNEKTRRFFVPLSNGQNKNAQVIETAIRDALSGFSVSSIIILRNAESPFSRVFGMIGKTALWAATLMIAGLFIPSFFKDFLSDRARRSSDRGRKIPLRKTPVAVSLLLAAAFIASGAAAGGAASVSQFALTVFPFALFLLGWTVPAWVRWRTAKRQGHVLFYPVALRGITPRLERCRPPVIIVCLFAVGVIASAVSTASFLSGSGGGTAGFSVNFSNEGYGNLVGEEEYRMHGQRQAGFAYLPLGINREEDAPPYRRYTEDASGLYVAAGTVEMETDREEGVIPAYPFDRLAAFIEGTGGPSATAAVSAVSPPLRLHDRWPESVPLFFIALATLLPFAILRVR